jgi:hypothetical protein
MNKYWEKVKKYWTRLPIESRGSIAIGIPLTCLLVAAVADTLLRQRLIEVQSYVTTPIKSWSKVRVA